MSDSDSSDRELTGREYEELCRNCDRLCNKQPYQKRDTRSWLHKNKGYTLAHGINESGEDDDGDRCPYNIIDMFGRRFKKDSRTWLHKSSKKRQHNMDKHPREIYGQPISPPPPQFVIEDHESDRTTRVDDGHSSDSDNPYTIVDSMGRRFKKDSRTWLHKSSSKRKKSKPQIEEEDDVPELPDTPTTLPGQQSFIDSREQDGKLHEIIKTGKDISKKYQSNAMLRSRKRRCQQMSLSTNTSPNDYRHNAEICRILSAEVDDVAGTRLVRKTASYDNIFELCNVEDDDYDGCRLPEDNTTMNNVWREASVIKSDTSTQSSDDNQELNQSPLSSGASINLSFDKRNNGSPVLTNTMMNNFHNKLPYRSHCFSSSTHKIDNIDATDGSAVWLDKDQTTNCPNQRECKVTGTLNANSASRSVCYLIAESDEFLADPILSEYEEESNSNF